MRIGSLLESPVANLEFEVAERQQILKGLRKNIIIAEETYANIEREIIGFNHLLAWARGESNNL